MCCTGKPGQPVGRGDPLPRLRAISFCVRKGTRGWWWTTRTTPLVYGVAHSLVEGPHVVNIFSFSKAWFDGLARGLPGLRPVARTADVESSRHGRDLRVPSSQSRLWRRCARTLMVGGRARIAALADAQKKHVLRALQPLGGGVGAADGADLRRGQTAARRRRGRRRVAGARSTASPSSPGSACGMPGFIRCPLRRPGGRGVRARPRARASEAWRQARSPGRAS